MVGMLRMGIVGRDQKAPGQHGLMGLLIQSQTPGDTAQGIPQEG